MKRYYKIVNIADKTAKSNFYEVSTGNNILSVARAFMEILGDYDVNHYRIFEYDTKTEWQAKQDSMRAVFDGAKCYFTADATAKNRV